MPLCSQSYVYYDKTNFYNRDGEATRMTTELTSETKEIKGFIASKQIKFFQDLKQQHFSGQVIFQDWSRLPWRFYSLSWQNNLRSRGQTSC